MTALHLLNVKLIYITFRLTTWFVYGQVITQRKGILNANASQKQKMGLKPDKKFASSEKLLLPHVVSLSNL